MICEILIEVVFYFFRILIDVIKFELVVYNYDELSIDLLLLCFGR